MTTSQPDLKALFLGALERPEGPERGAYLADACRGEASLRVQVEELLEAHVRAGVFLASATETAAKGDPDLAGGVAAEWLGPETARESLTPPGTNAEGPSSRIGSYTIIRKLGEGGMGIVFLAQQERPVHRKVALKVIKPGMDTEQVVARFEAERQALALMEHPGIARVLDAGATDSGRPFFVMELIDGVPINEYCDHERLSPRQRLELFVAVCRAIEHAHQRGVIHRDIKPTNVLVTLIDGQPVPKVIDFGVAKAIDQRLTERTLFTQHGALVGTPEYMSPEQAGESGAGIDTRSDVYALGVLLYELLTGTTPLGRVRLLEAAFSEVLRRIREEEPPRPSTRLSGSAEALASIAACRDVEPARLTKLVRGELDWITMKALEKDRARRYATALELGRDVRRYLDGDPVEASPPSLLYRAGKLARKHRGALLVAAGAVSMLVGAALVSWWLMLHTRPDERPAATSGPGQPAAAQDQAAAQQATRAKRERLLEIYGAEAAEYAIYRDASRMEKVELRPEPVYVWTNPLRGGGQDGAVYVWTCRGRAEALGSFFSYPASGQRHLSHEFHSLSLSVLDVERSGTHAKTWKPQAPGIAIAPIPDAPEPAPSAVQRLSQMRALTRDFSASTKDDQGRIWELRLLPQPLYRYASTDPDVVDGGLFGLVTSAGTDLEALLVIEARKSSRSSRLLWHHAAARFTDQELWMRHKGKEFFHATMILYDKPYPDPEQRYHAFTDRDIPPVDAKPR